MDIGVGILWQIAQGFKGYINRPKLVMDYIHVPIIRLLIPGEYYCKFLLGRVTNVGGRRAENCLGQIIVDGDLEREFKFHWSDESWKIRRDSAPKIDLDPTESRDLDIAFTICGKGAPSETGSGNLSGLGWGLGCLVTGGTLCARAR